MAWTDPSTPNLTDFSSWVYTSMEIPTAALPADSPWLQYAFDQAINLVVHFPHVPALTYVLAVYNCAGHLLVKNTMDQSRQNFFKCLRESLNLIAPEIGIIQASSNNGSSNSFAIGEGMQNMTIGDLNFYKTPWGRDYLAYAQDCGPSIWGLS